MTTRVKDIRDYRDGKDGRRVRIGMQTKGSCRAVVAQLETASNLPIT